MTDPPEFSLAEQPLGSESRSERWGAAWGLVVRASVAGLALTLLLLVFPTVTGAHDPAVRTPPEASSGDCVSAVAVVVGSDAAAQSDIYAAAMLAGVLGTECVVLAGPRDGAFPASQRRRLDSALQQGGYIVGGTAAVPAAKMARFSGHDLTRIAGRDRWETMRFVGIVAAGGEVPAVPAVPPPTTTTTTTPTTTTTTPNRGDAADHHGAPFRGEIKTCSGRVTDTFSLSMRVTISGLLTAQRDVDVALVEVEGWANAPGGVPDPHLRSAFLTTNYVGSDALPTGRWTRGETRPFTIRGEVLRSSSLTCSVDVSWRLR